MDAHRSVSSITIRSQHVRDSIQLGGEVSTFRLQLLGPDHAASPPLTHIELDGVELENGVFFTTMDQYDIDFCAQLDYSSL